MTDKEYYLVFNLLSTKKIVKYVMGKLNFEKSFEKTIIPLSKRPFSKEHFNLYLFKGQNYQRKT